MSSSIQCAARLRVDLPVEEAIALFTPEGERRWVEGWDPQYPSPDRTEGVGATFVTAHGARETVWVMVDSGPELVRYARTTPGETAGTVSVALVASTPHSSTFEVAYDLTSLDGDDAHLEHFASGYDEYIASWEREIARSLGGARSS